MPFPGTALFKQVVKDKLFIRSWNLDDLWKTPISHAQSEFLIKPYNMSVDDMYKWRKKFDIMQIKYWNTNPNAPRIARNLSLDKDGVVPRMAYGKKKQCANF
jgi:hypothetical protein